MSPTERRDEDSIPISDVQRLTRVMTERLINGMGDANGMVLEPIDPYTSTMMPFLPNLQDLVRRASGTNNLTSVVELKLKVITREAGLQHLSVHTPNLRELTLDGSHVSSLRDLGCRLHSLKVLKINRCRLRCLDGLKGLKNIEELYAAGNKMNDLTPCTSAEFLRYLDVSGNLITDINVVSFLKLNEKLTALVLEANEICSRSNYRNEVKCFIPQLQSLDGEVFVDGGNLPADSESNEKANKLLENAVTMPGTSGLNNFEDKKRYTVSFAPKVLSPRDNSNDTPASSEAQQITSHILPKIH